MSVQTGRMVSADEASKVERGLYTLRQEDLGHTIVVQAEQIAAMRTLLSEMVDPDPCWFDHNGGCQAHGYLSLEPGQTCPHADVKALLGVSGE